MHGNFGTWYTYFVLRNFGGEVFGFETESHYKVLAVQELPL